MKAARAGEQSGYGVYAASKRMPSRASRSRLGVRATWSPYGRVRNGTSWSARTTRMFGCSGICVGGAVDEDLCVGVIVDDARGPRRIEAVESEQARGSGALVGAVQDEPERPSIRDRGEADGDAVRRHLVERLELRERDEVVAARRLRQRDDACAAVARRAGAVHR